MTHYNAAPLSSLPKAYRVAFERLTRNFSASGLAWDGALYGTEADPRLWIEISDGAGVGTSVYRYDHARREFRRARHVFTPYERS